MVWLASQACFLNAAVAAVVVGSLIGLGCWLVGNQPAADAAPIKEQQRVEGKESEQRRSLAVCCELNKACSRIPCCWRILGALGENQRVTARKLLQLRGVFFLRF